MFRDMQVGAQQLSITHPVTLATFAAVLMRAPTTHLDLGRVDTLARRVYSVHSD